MWSVIFLFVGKRLWRAGCLIRHTDQPLLFSSPHPSASSNTPPPLSNPSSLLYSVCCCFFYLTEEVNGETGSPALTETGRIGGERSCCTQVRGKPTLLPAPSREFPSSLCLTHPRPFASSAVSSPSQNICRLSHLPIIRRSSLFVYLAFARRLFRCTSPLLYLTAFFLPQRNTGYVVFGKVGGVSPGGVRNSVEGRHIERMCFSHGERGAAWCFSVRKTVSAVDS